MADFRINYEQVIRQANKMNDLSSEMDREIQKIDNILSVMGSHWRGPASTVFHNKLAELISNMKKTKSEMSEVSSRISSIATKIQKEDESQAELARQLANK